MLLPGAGHRAGLKTAARPRQPSAGPRVRDREARQCFDEDGYSGVPATYPVLSYNVTLSFVPVALASPSQCGAPTWDYKTNRNVIHSTRQGVVGDGRKGSSISNICNFSGCCNTLLLSFLKSERNPGGSVQSGASQTWPPKGL